MTDIVVYSGPGGMLIFGFAMSGRGQYENSSVVNDLLTDERRAIVLKHLNDYRLQGCIFRTVLVGE